MLTISLVLKDAIMKEKEKTKFKRHPIPFPAKVEIIAIIIAGAPLFANYTFITSANGRVTSYMDYIAIACGILALIIGVTNYRLLKHTTDEDLLKRRIAFLGVIGMGAFQLMRGLGLFV
jgi:hypothetical protein